jgi:hypothetical protein
MAASPAPQKPLPSETPPKRKFGCLHGCLLGLTVTVFVIVVVVALIWQSVSWLKNAPEPTMAQYEPLNLSEGEVEDVNRVLAGIDEAKKAGADYDE